MTGAGEALVASPLSGPASQFSMLLMVSYSSDSMFFHLTIAINGQAIYLGVKKKLLTLEIF